MNRIVKVVVAVVLGILAAYATLLTTAIFAENAIRWWGCSWNSDDVIDGSQLILRGGICMNFWDKHGWIIGLGLGIIIWSVIYILIMKKFLFKNNYAK